jgi:hypothetical protein
MGTSDFVPFASVVAQLGVLCSQGLTGTVRLVSDDNRMAQVHLHGGQIAYVLCRGRRGRDALAIMRTMASARLTLDGVVAVSGAASDLPTATILAYLSGALAQLPEADGSVAAPAARAAAGAPAAAAAAVDFLTPPLRQACQQIVTRYIGPMAEIVCGEHFDDAADPRMLALALMGEVPGREHAKFKVEIAKALSLEDGWAD